VTPLYEVTIWNVITILQEITTVYVSTIFFFFFDNSSYCRYSFVRNYALYVIMTHAILQLVFYSDLYGFTIFIMLWFVHNYDFIRAYGFERKYLPVRDYRFVRNYDSYVILCV